MLTGKHVRLRILEMADAEFVRQLRNSAEVARHFQSRHFISDIAQESFIRSLAGATDRIYFIAERLADGARFGVVSATGIDHRNQRAENGIFLDSTAGASGVDAFEAAFLLLDYEFGYLNLRKVTAEVLAENARALRFNEALGMKPEGVRRGHLFADGRFQDLALLAMFRDDFYERPTPVTQSFLADREGPRP